MGNTFINWSVIAFVSIVFWLLGYVEHVKTTIYHVRAIQPPLWLTYVAARPKQKRLDVHGLAAQVFAVVMFMVQTILVFTVELHTDRIVYFGLIMAGVSVFIVLAIFILKHMYGVVDE